MQIVKKIIIDLSRKGTANVIDAVQYDVNTRVVEITLLQNGIPWNVPDGVTAAVGYKKSDGTRGLYDQLPDNSKAVSISGNVITAILVGQVLTVSGMVKASILMHDSNLNQLTTFPFDVNVVPNPSGTEEVSNDYYKYTTMQAVSDAVDAWLTETSEKQDTFLEAGSKALEVIKETINDGEDAPPIICAVNGEVIAVSDASDRLLRGLHLYGKTIQNGTPTPDAPVELESVGADGNVAVTVCGKNLLKYPYPRSEKTQGGVTYTVQNDGGVAISGAATGYSDFTLYEEVISKSLAGRFYWNIYGTYSNIVSQLRIFDNDMQIYESYSESGSLDLANYVGKKLNIVIKRQNNAECSGTCYPMFMMGEAPTAYEAPKITQTLTVQKPTNVSVFLPGIPVSSGGNYTDENGQMWVCDEVDFEKGVYVQRVGKILHKGTEPRAVTVMGNYVRTYFVGAANTGGTFSKALSDYLPYLVDYTQESEHFYIASNGDLFCFLKSERLSSVDAVGVQAYFADNPLTVLYVLGTPIETDLTAEEIAQYSALHTNYPNTTIYNDEGAGMGVKYVADTKMYIDNKFAELATAILNA